MRALILAAGEGTRLRPFTNNKPKALVELLGKPILLRQISILESAGIIDIGVATGYLGEEIKKLGLNCYYNSDYKNTNMVNSLFKARTFFKEDKDLIISYGDIVYQVDNLQKIIQSDAEISVAIDKEWLRYWKLRFKDPLTDAESLILNHDSTIKEIGLKTHEYKNIEGQYIGLIKVRKDKLKDFIKFYQDLEKQMLPNLKAFNNMYLTEFIQSLIDSSWEVKGISIKGGWLEVDSLTDLDLYENLSKDKKLAPLCRLD